MTKHKQKVHRSLLQREMMAGVPLVVLFFLFSLGLIFIYLLEIYISIVPIVIIYFVMRHLSKKDPWFIDIFMENIMQKDKYIP